MAEAQRSRAALARTTLAACFVSLAIFYFAIGVSWAWLNLWDQPPYADSMRYRWFSETLSVDRFHAGLYPLVLSFLNPWEGNLGWVQLLQWAVLALCLGYFVHALRCADFARDILGRRGALGLFGALLLLLLFDPLLVHFALSLMPDSLALSGCLAFSAALLELKRDRASVWIAVPVLLGGFILAAGVRLEKSWVLLLTALATLLVWSLAAREPGALFGPRLRTRSIGIVLALLVGFGSTQWLDASMYREPPPRIAQGLRLSPWSALTTIIHHRIIFPNLESVYQELSQASRARLTREDARIYDRKIHNTWAVTDRVTRRDATTRARLTQDLGATVLRNRWPSIALDIASDTLENLFAPVSFYLRLLAWSVTGADPGAWGERFEAAPWTYHALANSHPRISRLYVAVSGILFLFAGCLALLQARTRLRAESWRSVCQPVIWLAPVLLLCAANAAAFSLSSNLVHVRYSLFAYSAGLLLVYRSAFAWVFAQGPRSRASFEPRPEFPDSGG